MNKDAGFVSAIGKFFRPSLGEKIVLKKTVRSPKLDPETGETIFEDTVTQQEKEQIVPSLFQRIAFPLAATAATGAVIKELAVDPFMQARAEKQTLDQLKQVTPQLQDVDDQAIKDYFGVIQTFSPRTATNPLVSGALVNKMIQFEGVDSNLVKDLATIQGDNKGGLFHKLLEGGVAASSAAMAS
jgi:hypothetical protein